MGDNKLTAKHAARFAKPGGIHRLTRDTWMAEMGAKPAADLWGVGPKTAKELTALGVHTVADLAGASPSLLAGQFDLTGRRVRLVGVRTDLLTP